jgi:AraC-like DNA-binding protein
VPTVITMMQPTEYARIWEMPGFHGLEFMDVAMNTCQADAYLIPELTIGVRLEGSYQTRYRQQQFLTKPFDLAVFQAGEVVLNTSPTAQRLAFRCVSISASFWEQLSLDVFEKSLANLRINLMASDSSINQHLVAVYTKFHQSFAQHSTQLEREHHLVRLFRETVQHLAVPPKAHQKPGHEHRAVDLIKSFLKDHATQDVSLRALSALTGLNKSYLTEVFTRATGTSPHRYQTQLRILQAKKLLRSGVSASQVALETGFADQSHFGRVFKKHVFATPMQYQRQS